LPTLIVSKLSVFLTSAMIFNSTIISNNSFYRAELASFLAPAVGQMESKWKLCYNARAEKWSPEIFHRNCDDKKRTVTIIQKETYIFGGYTDIPWGGKGKGETLKAFIFSLKPSKPLPPFKCLVKDGSNAIKRDRSFGPMFGRLFIANEKKRSRATIHTSYSVPFEVKEQDRKIVLVGTASNFDPDNYEVFYLARSL